MSHFSLSSLFSVEYFPASYAFQVIQCTVYIAIYNYSINLLQSYDLTRDLKEVKCGLSLDVVFLRCMQRTAFIVRKLCFHSLFCCLDNNKGW